jgi:hypothetical protein
MLVAHIRRDVEALRHNPTVLGDRALVGEVIDLVVQRLPPSSR